MTDGILSTVEQWTGDRPASCPWAAFFDPFVHRVLTAHRAFESGNLAWAQPNPSHRLVQGVLHYDGVLSRCHALRMKQEAEERARG